MAEVATVQARPGVLRNAIRTDVEFAAGVVHITLKMPRCICALVGRIAE
jgi:hypothetical protein